MHTMGFNPAKVIKTEQEIINMREGGKIMARIMTELKKTTVPGIEIWSLEQLFLNLCAKYRVLPTCKGYTSYGLPPFPTGLCISINNESVHSIPKKDVILLATDIITVDTVITYKELNLDSAFCLAMPQASDKRKAIVKTAENAMLDAIAKVAEDIRIGEISEKLFSVAKKAGFNVLVDYAGHGIGYEMHEWPEVPCYGSKHEGPKLKAGMTICIEALICSKDSAVDNITAWETKMHDGGDFAQYEHTVLVTKKGFEILTNES